MIASISKRNVSKNNNEAKGEKRMVVIGMARQDRVQMKEREIV